ncbi:hypothetical protein, partial [Saccharothrix sp. ST-888]|uniref:hypothetical protein n=1 Tax=Saccharothrix sp. ST-888 TaxID=1427391 RepID=UPI003FA7374D
MPSAYRSWLAASSLDATAFLAAGSVSAGGAFMTVEARSSVAPFGLLIVDCEPDAYHDTHGQQLRVLPEAKLTGRETVPAAQAPESTNVVDLIDVLQRILRQAGSGHYNG